MFNKKTKKEEVYSSTEMSDLLSSPVFYAVIALTFILGLSAIFGFLNNPRKLKTVVDVMGQKLLINPNSNTVAFDVDKDYLLQKYSFKTMANNLDASVSETNNTDPYDITSKLNILESSLNVKKEIQNVSFDYDITSKQFWGNLDSSRIESALEEKQRQKIDALMIGAPLSSEYSLEQGDKKYSMAAGIIHL